MIREIREVDPLTPLVDEVATAIQRLLERGEEVVYEVDVIIACHPAAPWEIRRAFRQCVERGWIAPSDVEPDAFVARSAERSCA